MKFQDTEKKKKNKHAKTKANESGHPNTTGCKNQISSINSHWDCFRFTHEDQQGLYMKKPFKEEKI